MRSVHDIRRLAESWLIDNTGRLRDENGQLLVKRKLANDEEHLALDVLEMLTELEGLGTERDALRASLEDTRTHLDRVVKQRNRDHDALTLEIAKAIGTSEDRELAECDEIGDFDPWDALRKFNAGRDALRASLMAAEAERDALRASLTASDAHHKSVVTAADGVAESQRETTKEVQQLREERDVLRSSLIHACELQEETYGNRRELWAMRQTANLTSLPYSHDRVYEKYKELGDWADALKEIERLTTCLRQANDSSESFERLWYLAQDEVEIAREKLAAWEALAERDHGAPIKMIEKLQKEILSLSKVYGVAASMRVFPVPFNDHGKLADAVDVCRQELHDLEFREDSSDRDKISF